MTSYVGDGDLDPFGFPFHPNGLGSVSSSLWCVDYKPRKDSLHQWCFHPCRVPVTGLETLLYPTTTILVTSLTSPLIMKDSSTPHRPRSHGFPRPPTSTSTRDDATVTPVFDFGLSLGKREKEEEEDPRTDTEGTRPGLPSAVRSLRPFPLLFL